MVAFTWHLKESFWLKYDEWDGKCSQGTILTAKYCKKMEVAIMDHSVIVMHHPSCLALHTM